MLMNYRWIGAGLVFLTCGSLGFSIAAEYRKEIQTLRSLITLLDMMECELSYRLTPLPELCRKSAAGLSGGVRRVMLAFARELEQQICPDAGACMGYVLNSTKGLTPSGQKYLKKLGISLGRFDLAGQLTAINALREECALALGDMNRDRQQRLRGYQTLGLCAGAALVILLV